MSPVQKSLISVCEASYMLNCSNQKVYYLIKTGQIKSRKVRGIHHILRISVEAYANRYVNMPNC